MEQKVYHSFVLKQPAALLEYTELKQKKNSGYIFAILKNNFQSDLVFKCFYLQLTLPLGNIHLKLFFPNKLHTLRGYEQQNLSKYLPAPKTC